MPKHNIYVVKFGGSIASGPLFLQWVRLLLKWAEDHAVCVVPGGGAIAEAVRTLQTHTGLDDVTAHELALIAMRQMGMTIRACSAQQFEWVSLQDLTDATRIKSPMLWVPDIPEFEVSELPKDWSVTSDSIALWLAGYLNAKELILLKSVPPPGLPVEAWARVGYVDSYFDVLSMQVSIDVRAVSKLDEL